MPAYLSIDEAIASLSGIPESGATCLGAEGFWRIGDAVQSSLDHILDLSSRQPPDALANATDAIRVLNGWPRDGDFLVELVFATET